jgi:hypothetical protein
MGIKSFMVTRNLREQMTADGAPQAETSTTEDNINLHTQPLSGFDSSQIGLSLSALASGR